MPFHIWRIQKTITRNALLPFQLECNCLLFNYVMKLFSLQILSFLTAAQLFFHCFAILWNVKCIKVIMNHLWWKCYTFSISKNYIVSEGGWKEEKKAMIAMWKKFHSVPITNQVECEVRARGEMWHEAKVLMLCVMHLMSFWCAYKFEMAVSCWNLNYFSTLRQKYNEKLKTKMKTKKHDIAKEWEKNAT